MSFQSYEAFQNQPGQQEAGGAGNGVPQPQDGAMPGQQMDNTPVPFQGVNPGEMGPGGSPGGEIKTTLW